ncbi:MAG: hypothetical protein JOY80_00595, partial [Candidatus Dormibacteraeota bacterium]|nr:hypothetical protein [Candidatus Dormibacteraeota bacterium]
MSQNATFWFPPTGRVIAQVPFLFGIAGRPELGGLALQLLLGDLGMSPPAARTLIARMRRD